MTTLGTDIFSVTYYCFWLIPCHVIMVWGLLLLHCRHSWSFFPLLPSYWTLGVKLFTFISRWRFPDGGDFSYAQKDTNQLKMFLSVILRTPSEFLRLLLGRARHAPSFIIMNFPCSITANLPQFTFDFMSVCGPILMLLGIFGIIIDGQCQALPSSSVLVLKDKIVLALKGLKGFQFGFFQ